MKCLQCGARTRVVHTQQKPDGAHRWLRCTACGAATRTLETYFNPEPIPSAAVLTPEDVQRLRASAASGTNQSDLAFEYSLTRETVNRIANRKRWTHVP